MSHLQFVYNLHAMYKYLRVHETDNLVVALQDLDQGEYVDIDEDTFPLLQSIRSKHKFVSRDLTKGEALIMYGVEVGRALRNLLKGEAIGVDDLMHSAGNYTLGSAGSKGWKAPSIEKWKDRTFDGFVREDGSVGTRNIWLVFPLVFCENRNVLVLKEEMEDRLGYGRKTSKRTNMDLLINGYRSGMSAEELLQQNIDLTDLSRQGEKVFEQIDGLKFITHGVGCGETRQDSETFCRLMAGYVTNPNVAGATVLSLGCQNAEVAMFKKAVHEKVSEYSRKLVILEQQQSSSERAFIADAIKQTFAGMAEANRMSRQAVSIEHLTIGLECGGSDGFSGISANPTVGQVSDLLVAVGGKAILAEFPELNGVEQELINRCESLEVASKFSNLMARYKLRAEQSGSGFHANPSPGNIRDGLITDAMKSAGAAKKGGTSPVRQVLDYTEKAERKGLSLLCTPGNDVESTTGLAASGANMILFTTGLGTPTGNPVVPVIKISSNTNLANKMQDLIDFDTGEIIGGGKRIEQVAEELLELIIEVASGKRDSKAMILQQDDFIPWRRGISL